jgi:hypothetical protein
MSAAVGRSNLIELVDQNKHLFYQGNRQWWEREAFMRILPEDTTCAPPTRIIGLGKIPKSDAGLPRAVDLAHAYIADSTNPIWQNWIWCADKDANGQRVFVGVVNGLFEFHRHLAISTRWGQASWS